ncbi:unnamed protein product [Rhodiola kirilowii]
MGSGNKYRRPTMFRCNAGRSFILSIVALGLVAFISMLQLFSLLSHRALVEREAQWMRIDQYPYFRELVEVEEDIKIPPPRKRSARAMKRKPKKTYDLTRRVSRRDFPT